MAVVLIAVLVATLAPRIRLGPQVPTGGLPIGQRDDVRSSSPGRQRPLCRAKEFVMPDQVAKAARCSACTGRLAW
jgi:hypothetical protein